MEYKDLLLKLQKIEDSCSINKISKLNSNGLVYLLGKINQELKTLKREIK